MSPTILRIPFHMTTALRLKQILPRILRSITGGLTHTISPLDSVSATRTKLMKLTNLFSEAEFGFGLTYSTFEYNDIQLKVTPASDKHSVQETNEKFADQKNGESIYDVLVTVSCKV